MAMRRKYLSERDQLELFRAWPGVLAPRDAQDLMAYPFCSLAKTKRVVPFDFHAGAISIRVEAVPEHGMAAIWDADVPITTNNHPLVLPRLAVRRRRCAVAIALQRGNRNISQARSVS